MKDLIRVMNQDELQMVMSWAKDEGWNPGKHDYKSYYSYDNTGFLILLRDNEAIAAISVVKHSKDFAFIGLFIVKPKYRNQGIGAKIWGAAMEHLSNHQSVGLYAVPAQVPRYNRSQFFKSHSSQRWCMDYAKRENVAPLINHSQNPVSAYAEMLQYDQRVWGTSRKNFFDTLLQQPNSFAYVTFDQKTGHVNGYGVIRPLIKGFRVGPMYCDTAESAKTITRILLSQAIEGQKVIFDIPSKNKFSFIFSQYFGLTRIKASDTEAMFKGMIHNSKEEICYGIASLEIG